MSDIERRFVDLQTTITGTKLGGYAAIYNERCDIAGLYWEMLEPTAFRSALAAPDLEVVGLFNHNPDNLLARTGNDSLRLSNDSHGLAFELDIPETSLGNDLRSMIDAGLITGCSFAFVAGEQRWDRHEGRDLRVHTSVSRIVDVSVVTTPAYSGTSVALRSKPSRADLRTQILCAKTRNLRKEHN